MRKIYTVTFHRSKSHGALLQCYALNKFLLNHGFDAEVLDYRPAYFASMNQVFPLKDHGSSSLLKGSIKNILLYHYRSTMNHKFDEFRNKIRFTKSIYTRINELKKESFQDDIFICGSDQIWNPEITNGFDDVYVLDFLSKQNRKFSYGGSTGIDLSDRKCDKKKLNEKLKSFEKIMVREPDVLKVLTDDNKAKSAVVCDPVFLLSKEEWESLVKDRIIKEEYILIYDLTYDLVLYKQAIKYAKEHSLKIVEVQRNEVKAQNSTYDQRLIVSPDELLNLLYYSSFNFTNSFHGTCFSIIFQKDFQVYVEPTRGMRIMNLLKKVSLEAQLLEAEGDVTKVDYAKVKKILEAYAESSRSLLIDSIMKKQ